jgi:hypothetical protein
MRRTSERKEVRAERSSWKQPSAARPLRRAVSHSFSARPRNSRDARSRSAGGMVTARFAQVVIARHARQRTREIGESG